MRQVAVGGGTLPVETLGADDAPPLILLHGWTLDRRMWRPQLALAAHFRLIAPDRRGFGAATAPADLGAEPDDVLRIADAAGLERFALVGMSQGGKVALAAAARAGSRVTGIVLVGTALDGVDAPGEHVPFAAMATAALRGTLSEMRAAWADHPLTRLHADGADQAGDVAAMLADYDGRDLVHGAGRLEVTASIMARISAPVLALVGQGDTPHRHANARALSRLGAACRSVPGAGHLCNIDQPSVCNTEIRNWISQACR
ncbi:alpha/beta hydrolase [Sandarakinorhabdus sp.]|uniref:alpha/beta fold hydrolase n=1 Tax=Sandarakinorhabdus sp. TaxID=1916663 RepID=UPI00286DB33B|nr:alpha/beta hydrolase [Sandarakinorhabdus sp.]